MFLKKKNIVIQVPDENKEKLFEKIRHFSDMFLNIFKKIYILKSRSVK